MTFHEKLAHILEEWHIELPALADLSGVGYEAVRSYAKPGSKRIPNAANGIAIAKTLGVDPRWLFDDTQDWPPLNLVLPGFKIHFWPPALSWPEIQAAIALWAVEKARMSVGYSEQSNLTDVPGFPAPCKSLTDHGYLIGTIMDFATDNSENTKLAREFLSSHPIHGEFLAWIRHLAKGERKAVNPAPKRRKRR